MLAGSPALRTAIDDDATAEDIAAGWIADCDRFEALRRRFFLY
ncbi:MAG: hypothetical protein ACRD2N_13965 [Vicinamibacterales bacterium]